jgi:WD40 repeat protein
VRRAEDAASANRSATTVTWRHHLPDSARHLCWVDDSLVAACDNGTVLCLDTGPSPRTVDEGPTAIHRLNSAPRTLSQRDGVIAIGAQDGTAVRREGRDFVKALAPTSIVASVVTPAGAVFATGDELLVLDDAGSKRHPLDIGLLTSLAALGDRLVAVGGVHGLCWFDVVRRSPQGCVRLPTIVAVEADPLQRSVVAGELGGSMHVLEPHHVDGIELSGFSDRVAEVAWLASGAAVCGVCDDEITRWDRTVSAFVEEPSILAGHDRPITALAAHPRLDLLASGDDGGMVIVWAPHVADEPIWRGHLDGIVLAVAWDGTGRRLAATSSDGTLIWLPTPSFDRR